MSNGPSRGRGGEKVPSDLYLIAFPVSLSGLNAGAESVKKKRETRGSPHETTEPVKHCITQGRENCGREHNLARMVKTRLSTYRQEDPEKRRPPRNKAKITPSNQTGSEGGGRVDSTVTSKKKTQSKKW